MAVVIDPEPHHVPAGMVGVADAEEGKLGGANGVARAPEEGEGAALGLNVTGRAVSEGLFVTAAQRAATSAIGDGGDLGLVGGRGATGRGKISGRAVITREVEEQAGFRGEERRRD